MTNRLRKEQKGGESATETSEWLRVLAAMPDALASVPGIHMVDGGLTPKRCLLTSTVQPGICAPTPPPPRLKKCF